MDRGQRRVGPGLGPGLGLELKPELGLGLGLELGMDAAAAAATATAVMVAAKNSVIMRKDARLAMKRKEGRKDEPALEQIDERTDGRKACAGMM
ncbi:GL23162 [Drosophila persimilis]|uniref:GL23162 n=1 Tax=Drosophila persimilis TaxID=7234 RepID=B4G5I2_DROPE|nr:GL23162 [Drosophila persimilis]